MLRIPYIHFTEEQKQRASSVDFRPLLPTLETKLYFIWKKYQVFSQAAELLLEEMKNTLLE